MRVSLGDPAIGLDGIGRTDSSLFDTVRRPADPN
jgi:hypothetical protein